MSTPRYPVHHTIQQHTMSAGVNRAVDITVTICHLCGTVVADQKKHRAYHQENPTP